MATHDKILRTLCPNIPPDEIMTDESSHEFTFVFRLITLNLPSFEVELTMINFSTDDQIFRS